MNKKILSLFVAFLLLIAPIKAFALDLDYLDNSTWNDNPNVTSVNISGKSGSNTMRGAFRYYFDSDNSCFYTYFNVSETTLSEYDDIVKVHFDIKSDTNTYSFSVDENGLVDYGDEEYDYFNSFQSLEIVNDNTARFMTAIEMYCKLDVYTVDVKLHINGRNYKIANGLIFDTRPVSTTKPATTKQATTKAYSNKTQKPTTSSSKSAKSSSTKSTTKYKATGDYSSNEALNDVENDSVQAQAGELKPKLSKSAKIILVIAIIIAIVGVGFVISSAFKSKKDVEDNQAETQEK